MINIRAVFLAHNAICLRLFSRTGVPVELVNCGAAPNDGVGDSLEDAMEKVARNANKFIDYFLPAPTLSTDLRDELTDLLAEVARHLLDRRRNQYENELAARATLLLERIEEEE